MNKSAHRVCIVTPGQIGSNPRVVKEASALSEAGYDVTVIASKVLPLVEVRDQAIASQVTWKLLRVDISNRATWRWARLKQVLSRRVCRIAPDFLAETAHSAFTPLLRKVALEIPAELYIAHYPAALPAAAAAAKKHNAILAYDAEDFHLGDLPAMPAHVFDTRLVRALESRYLPVCSYVTAASPGIAAALADEYNIRTPAVILNTFELPRAIIPPHEGPTRLRPPSLYWFSQKIGFERGIEVAVNALKSASTQPTLYLRGDLDPAFLGYLEKHTAEPGLGDRCHILPPALPDEMETLAAEYDFGLVSETASTPNRDICLTNKLFTYILAGCVPLMSNTKAHIEFAHQWGLEGLVYDAKDGLALAGLIDQLWSDQDGFVRMREKIWRIGRERLNWDVEKRSFLDLVQKTLTSREVASNAG
jgi:glycosyltransferase involved in cell wall biosynthesis